MAGTSVKLGHVYVVRWDTITRGDFEQVLQTLTELKQTTGKDVVYVAVQDDRYVTPDKETTELMKARFAEFSQLIKADYIVMAAKGLKASMQRSFLRAAIAGGALVGVKGVDKVVVVSTLEEVFAREAGNLPTSAAGMLEALAKADVLPRG